MIDLETLPSMTEPMNRHRLVGWIVRDAIINEGITFTEASRRWPIALPTLNRLMNTGNVGLRFYRLAEKNLPTLPPGILEMVIDGKVDTIRQLPGLNENLRSYILRELEAEPPSSRRRPTSRPRKRA